MIGTVPEDRLSIWEIDKASLEKVTALSATEDKI